MLEEYDDMKVVKILIINMFLIKKNINLRKCLLKLIMKD